MKTWVRKSMRAGVLAAGFLLFMGASPAQAQDQVAVDNGGVLAGNNISIPINAAVPICGNGIGAVIGAGVGIGACQATAGSEVEDDDKEEFVAVSRTESLENDQISYDNGGLIAGNNINVPINAAIPVCGNGIGAVIGAGVGIGACQATAGDEVEDEDDDDNGDPYTRLTEDDVLPSDAPAPSGLQSALPGNADLNVPDATLPLVNDAPTDLLSSLVGVPQPEYSLNGTDLGSIVEERVRALQDLPLLS